MTKIISVYFNGTDDRNAVPKHGRITLAALLDQITIKDDINNYSICVNGCGIETQDIRDLGAIFTFHLEKQVLKIAKQVKDMVNDSEDKVVLNVYGFSRGGAAAFLLCQKLKHISAEYLTINVASFEPVPGNFILGVYGDLLFGTNSTLSAAVADLTECKNIANMLVLFTNKPLPDIACHAPILPALPVSCETEVDVTPGCHKSAVSFYKEENSIQPSNNESAIVFHRIVEFMQKCGTTFNFDQLLLDPNLIYSSESEQGSVEVDKHRLLSLYEELTRKTAFLNDGQNRSMHLHNTIFTKDSKQYLNRYHQQLCNVETVNDKDCVLTIQNNNPQRMSTQQRHMIQFTQLAFLIAMMLIIYNKYFNETNSENNNQFRPH